MARCCGMRGKAAQPTPAHSSSDGRLPQGVNSLMGPLQGQARACGKCGGPMRVLHQYSSGGRDIQAYSCMVCSNQEDIPLVQ
jgi:hypothetical protein